MNTETNPTFTIDEIKSQVKSNIDEASEKLHKLEDQHLIKLRI